MQHLAMIMDGNRRWARENKLAAVTMGHQKGAETIRTAVKFCIKNDIKYLSLYAFSLENVKRSEAEKTFLFDLLARTLTKNLDALIRQGVRIRFVGDRALFPENIKDFIHDAEERTKDLDKLCLNILFYYGSQQEMVYAAKNVAKKVQDGVLHIDDIDEATFRKELWVNGTPDPDLIIRTGNSLRLSNFLLFQAAYTELMFLDRYWPEVDEQCLQDCVEQFHYRQRNYGK